MGRTNERNRMEQDTLPLVFWGEKARCEFILHFDGMLTEIFPQRSSHERLFDAVCTQQFIHLFFRKQMNGYIFGIFQMLGRNRLYAGGNEAMTNIGHGAGISRYFHVRFPFSAAESGFFIQFPFCRFERCLSPARILRHRFRNSSARYRGDIAAPSRNSRPLLWR